MTTADEREKMPTKVRLTDRLKNLESELSLIFGENRRADRLGV